MEEAHTDLGVLEAPGFPHLCICQRRQGGPGSCSWSPPAQMCFCPCPSSPCHFVPVGVGSRELPAGGETA